MGLDRVAREMPTQGTKLCQLYRIEQRLAVFFSS